MAPASRHPLRRLRDGSGTMPSFSLIKPAQAPAYPPILQWVQICALMLIVTACGSPRPVAPVEERVAAPTRRINHHYVAPGETLYSIAWRYGLDYRTLARLNGLDRRFSIRAGQRLALDAGAAPAPITASSSAPAPARPQTRPPVSRAPVATSALAGPLRWQWPTPGRLVQRFGAGTIPHKGIDIRGELGEPVVVAAPGTVVYAGSGLVGYGNLVIVKHTDRYLSAYGHNSRLWVVEGQKIKAGERIADIGDTGTDSPMLHFEIRLDGQPVDPVSVLPRR